MTDYTYNARDDALVAWNKSFTNRIGDGSGDPEEEYLEVLKLIATCKSKGRILDVGCGLGRMIGVIRDRVAGPILGLEPDGTRFRECHAAFHDGAGIQVMNTTSTEYKAGHPQAAFDMVIVSMVIQHVTTAICRQILEDVAALLAPDGIGVVATTQQDAERFTYQTDQSSRTVEEFDRYASASDTQRYGIPVRQFSKDSFFEVLDRAGLRVIRWGQFSYLRPEKVAWFATWMGSQPQAIENVGTSQYAVVQRAAQ